MKTQQDDPFFKPKRRKRARLVLLISTVLMAAIGFSVIIANITGSAQFVVVLSDSMEPSVARGSLTVTQVTPPENVQAGDIIAVGVNSLTETRISRIDSITSTGGVYSYTLWADNTPLQDPWLHRTISDMNLVVWSAPLLGWPFLIISNPFFVFFMILASVLLARHYTMNIFEYNKRQVYARRIAEERLESMKYGGVDSIVDLFEDVGGLRVKVGSAKEVRVSSVEELDELVEAQEREIEQRMLAKLQKREARRMKKEKGENVL